MDIPLILQGTYKRGQHSIPPLDEDQLWTQSAALKSKKSTKNSTYESCNPGNNSVDDIEDFHITLVNYFQKAKHLLAKLEPDPMSSPLPVKNAISGHAKQPE